MNSGPPRILYCHCRYAQVVPPATKDAVLRSLCESGVGFEAVADLCELSARRDPALERLARGGAVKIAACYPRAVKWLFANAGSPLVAQDTEVLNMRTLPAEDIAAALRNPALTPNLPADRAPATPAAVSSHPAA